MKFKGWSKHTFTLYLQRHMQVCIMRVHKNLYGCFNTRHWYKVSTSKAVCYGLMQVVSPRINPFPTVKNVNTYSIERSIHFFWVCGKH